METEDNNFIVDITENLKAIELFLTCQVCKNIFTEPTIILHCAHTFCKKCLEGTRKCPNCGENYVSHDMLFNRQINYMKNCFIHMNCVINKQTLVETSIPNIEYTVQSCDADKKNNINNIHRDIEHSKQQSENFIIEQINNDTVTAIKYVWMNVSRHDFCKKNHLGETELQKACIQNKIDTVKMLLSKGASVNVVDNFKWSPLHEVAKNGNMEICELLLNAGSILDIPNVDYKTPLHSAAEYKQNDIIKILLENGADSNLPCYNGMRVLDMYPDVKNILSSIKKISTVIPCIHEPTGIEVVFAKHQQLSRGKFSSKTSNVVTEKTTHFILNDLKTLENISVSLLKAIIQGLWVVDNKWYDVYKDTQKNINPKSYEMTWTNFKCADEFVFKKARINRQLLRPRLFSGCKIYLHGTKYQKNTLTITKEEMVDIIKAGDGEILKRCPKPECIPRDQLNYPFHARINKLNSCSHFIVYLTEKPYQPEYKFKELRTLPVLWIIDCILKHKIIDPDEFINHMH